ncbi:hypothetical protein [Geomicrobium sediminis]|uniref:Uncharacterized protein n=1 Tax=Geomicrobium sediminis TaxID=1347788 RepID=A0ABS2PCS0_9BACL|nr:hypothetical protein [Geomicrobium sediminis]MBM7633228.1 hypothetical protein [Geomicrobium sediminis]
MKRNQLYVDMAFTSIVVSVLYAFFVRFLHGYSDDIHLVTQDESVINVILSFLSIALVTMFIIAPANFYVAKLGNVKGPIVLSIVVIVIIVAISMMSANDTPLLFLLLTPIFCLASAIVKLLVSITNSN